MSDLRARTILVTGGSGVVGQALLRRLSGVPVIGLVHRRELPGPVESVRGSIEAPRLGLSEPVYRELASRVDAVIHCAAITGFTAPEEAVTATNVQGTSRIAEFAADADAPLYHVSTAFMDSARRSEMSAGSLRYAESKRLGEQIVRSAGIPHVIVRPSIVIGDSVTGQISQFQGVYYVAMAVFNSLLPMVPFGADWMADLVPQDLVADVLARLVERDVRSGELWVTAGPQAPTVGQVIGDMQVAAGRYEIPQPPRPRYVDPDMYQRLIKPVFLQGLPPAMRKTVVRMFDHISPYLVGSEPYPSSMPELRQSLDLQPVPDVRTCLATSLDYWAHASGFTRRTSALQVSEVAAL